LANSCTFLPGVKSKSLNTVPSWMLSAKSIDWLKLHLRILTTSCCNQKSSVGWSWQSKPISFFRAGNRLPYGVISVIDWSKRMMVKTSRRAPGLCPSDLFALSTLRYSFGRLLDVDCTWVEDREITAKKNESS
jgi:hypothetical protein